MANNRNKRTFTQWCIRYLMNFSLITIVCILVYILFFTDTSVQTTYHYEQMAENLRQEIEQESDSLEYYRQLNQKLTSDPVTVEKEAREQYRMQRPHEDIYIIK